MGPASRDVRYDDLIIAPERAARRAGYSAIGSTDAVGGVTVE